MTQGDFQFCGTFNGKDEVSAVRWLKKLEWEFMHQKVDGRIPPKPFLDAIYLLMTGEAAIWTEVNRTAAKLLAKENPTHEDVQKFQTLFQDRFPAMTYEPDSVNLNRELSELQQKDDQVPLVAITMGSDSDQSVLTAGVDLLKALKIPHMVTITSAHRTPERMFKFAREAASRGIKVIIAAAGGAAHLPGMIAAITTLPVIGIPVKGSVLDGNDSLLSIVQMPRGCPVATVAINNSVNAAQLAVRILALDDVDIRKKLEVHLADQTTSVIEKAERMERVGFEAYGLKKD